MFLITDMLFFHGNIELQRARIRTQYFDSRFAGLLLKSRLYCSVEDYSPVAITNKNIIFLSVTELKNSVFLDLVLLSCTPVATNSFWSSYTATLSSTCFWIFLPSGIQSGEETNVGRQRLNRQRLPKLEIWASASIVYCLLFCLPFIY